MDGKVLLELFLVFLKIGVVMFGGGYAMIPILRYEVVVRRQWLSEQEFIDLIAIAESTPGPIAINSATYIGYKIGGIAGSVLATAGVVIPSFSIILAIAIGLSRFYTHKVIRGVLNGIRAAIVGLILSAVITVVKGVLKGLPILPMGITIAIAVAVFVSVVILDLDPVVMLGLSALIGLILTLLGVW
ncbi:MAG: chromate transporter [Desulfurococcaceae archaeon]|nr:chromate transporter [Desulfurococcaceae archaeon]